MEKYPEKKAYFILSNEAADLRLMYVSQNAFYHLVKHMQEALTLYFMWLIVGNDDKERIEFKTDEEAESLQRDDEVHLPVEGIFTIVDVNLIVCLA